MTTLNGDWMDEYGTCRVCGGEIPHGHSNSCDIYKQEREITRLEALVKCYKVQEQENMGIKVRLRNTLKQLDRILRLMPDAPTTSTAKALDKWQLYTQAINIIHLTLEDKHE